MAGFNKTSIEWVHPDPAKRYTSNPIWGCAKGCPYCYAKSVAARFGMGDFSSPCFYPGRLAAMEAALSKREDRVGVFLCSMSDFFGEEVQNLWQRCVVKEIKALPQHQFFILTKRPRSIPGALMTKAGLSLAIGVTVESRDQAWRITELKHKWPGRRFASLEPLLGPIPPDLLRGLDWIIIGGLSGSWLPEGWSSRRSLAEAQAEWSRPIIRWARDAGIPVLVKSRPAQIPGLDLQQYPDWFDQERPEQQQARMF